MHYFIDGYNLMFRVLRAGSDLKVQREQFIADLGKKTTLLNLQVTLFFDAHYQNGEGSRTRFASLEIYYTDQGETADEFILKKLKEATNPEAITVVTSDNRLAWSARRLLAKTETVPHFMAWLNKRYLQRSKKKEEATSFDKLPPRKQVVSQKDEGAARPIRETEMERWLRIFEERLKGESDNDIIF